MSTSPVPGPRIQNNLPFSPLSYYGKSTQNMNLPSYFPSIPWALRAFTVTTAHPQLFDVLSCHCPHRAPHCLTQPFRRRGQELVCCQRVFMTYEHVLLTPAIITFCVHIFCVWPEKLLSVSQVAVRQDMDSWASSPLISFSFLCPALREWIH